VPVKSTADAGGGAESGGGIAEEDRELVADQFAPAAGEDGWQAGQARPLLLADAGREPSDAPAVREHGAADRSATGADGVKNGPDRLGGRDVKRSVGNTHFVGFRFCAMVRRSHPQALARLRKGQSDQLRHWSEALGVS
jgi:hypothetical protein